MPVPARSRNIDFFVFSGILGIFGCVAGVGTDIAGVVISPRFGFVALVMVLWLAVVSSLLIRSAFRAVETR